ncbi:MAG: hypothetical protein HN403_07990 [Rhodospirillales bacterium]|jgi:hypothetical protein|nr:hypothetical protein [Rhodospirillales bacterium]
MFEPRVSKVIFVIFGLLIGLAFWAPFAYAGTVAPTVRPEKSAAVEKIMQLAQKWQFQQNQQRQFGQQPQVPGRFMNQLRPQPQIPGAQPNQSEPVMCQTSGYTCPAQYQCRPLRRTGTNQYQDYYECIPQGTTAEGCFVGYRRQNSGNGSYTCTPVYPRGTCADGRATWGPRDNGPGLRCRHIT